MSSKKIQVGSNNPVKLKATESAFAQVWPEYEFSLSSIDVASGVSDQPMSDQEAIQGAIARARQAVVGVQYGIGLEGGLHQIDDRWFSCGWAAIVDSDQTTGIASSARIQVPTQMIELIHQGKELGEIDDILFGVQKSNQYQGNYGLMTNGLITRKNSYEDALICALTRFTQTDLY